MASRIAFKEELCTACSLCTMYCSLTFSRQSVYEFRPSIARIRVAVNPEDTKYAAHVCLQCEDADCLKACPEGAVSKNADTGVVQIDKDICTGCGLCAKACTYDAVFIVNRKAVKCEVCDDPLCVKACARKALSLVEDDDTAEQAGLYEEVRL